jgi:hypothetical protein
MNFLAHYFLDRNHPSSEFVVGAATPDLLSIYNSNLRIKAGQVDHLNTEARANGDPQFLAGLARHFHADRVFHSSPLFATETQEFSALLERTYQGQNVPRKYFISHIMLELLLDKVLIRHDTTLLDDYYRHFESLAPFHAIRKDTEIVSGHPLPNYESFLAKFVENKYLYHYTNNDHLIYILRRLLRRVHIDDNKFLDDPRFLQLMDQLEVRIEGYYLQFFEEIRAKE